MEAAEAATAKRRADEEAVADPDPEKGHGTVRMHDQPVVRIRLLEQFNRVLPATDTPRGW